MENKVKKNQKRSKNMKAILSLTKESLSYLSSSKQGMISHNYALKKVKANHKEVRQFIGKLNKKEDGEIFYPVMNLYLNHNDVKTATSKKIPGIKKDVMRWLETEEEQLVREMKELIKERNWNEMDLYGSLLEESKTSTKRSAKREAELIVMFDELRAKGRKIVGKMADIAEIKRKAHRKVRKGVLKR